MNCPECGVVHQKFAIHTTDCIYDSENKLYYRKCRCSKCKKQFFTVEFEIECDQELLEAFDFSTPPPNAKVESSKKRFNDYRALHKKISKMRKGSAK